MKIINVTTKFKLLHVTNHLIALIGIYTAVSADQYWWFLLGLLCFLWTGIVGVNVSLHRYYSHVSFKTSKFKERILLWSSVFTGLGSPAMWCSIHRMHHVYSDTEKDPHNPRINGIFKTWFSLWPINSIPKRFIVPFLKNKELKFIHNNYFLINFLVLLILALIDIRIAAFIISIPAVGCFHGAQSIGVLPHFWGYRRYNTKDLSYNNWLASIFALGEGWHNNHHANPGRWWQGETWWELDPPAFMIKHFFMLSNKDESKNIT
jgi:stearoyl-CoA desaturase (delta-9 desaturase)